MAQIRTLRYVCRANLQTVYDVCSMVLSDWDLAQTRVYGPNFKSDLIGDSPNFVNC